MEGLVLQLRVFTNPDLVFILIYVYSFLYYPINVRITHN